MDDKTFHKIVANTVRNAKDKWFKKAFKEFGSLADNKGYIAFKPEIIGTEKFDEEKQIKWEKMLEHQLYMHKLKMDRPDGRLKGFWIKRRNVNSQ